MKYGNLLDKEELGRWVADSESTLEVINSFTREEIHRLPKADGGCVERAAMDARGAQKTLRAMSPEQRGEALKNFKKAVYNNIDTLATLIQIEVGKSRDEALESVLVIGAIADYNRSIVSDICDDESRMAATPLSEVTVTKEPYGIAGVILPWNYPVALFAFDVLPAIASGNSVLVKPSEEAPLSSSYASVLLKRAGLPADSVQVLPGGADAGSKVVKQSDVIAFTGSTETGRKVGRSAGEDLKPHTLELGGCNPALVFNDANKDDAVSGVLDSSFATNGQFCMSTERVYVQDNMYGSFLESLVERVENMKVGDPREDGVDIGPLIADFQVDRVKRHVREAREDGATIVTGGSMSDKGETVFMPTIITNTDGSREYMREETFGPVVYVNSFSSVSEGISMANETDSALSAAVWTSDTDFGKKVARAINAGSVSINDSYTSTLGALSSPMGGWSQSGLGYRNGPEGMERYLKKKTIGVMRGPNPYEAPLLSSETYSKIMAKVFKRVPFYR